jgi:hypothetical protein
MTMNEAFLTPNQLSPPAPEARTLGSHAQPRLPGVGAPAAHIFERPRHRPRTKPRSASRLTTSSTTTERALRPCPATRRRTTSDLRTRTRPPEDLHRPRARILR